MDKSTTKEKLPPSFTRPQLRRLRQLPTRDPNAWMKLLRTSTSPPTTVTTARTAKPSTSAFKLEDEDGLPVPILKRSRHSKDSQSSKGTAPATRKIQIPRDDSVDEAMSGFEFMNIDHSQPLQDKSNIQSQSALKKHVFYWNAAKHTESNKTSSSSQGMDTVRSSTPPNDTPTHFKHDFATLEAANLSTIAPIPKYRFLGKSASNSSVMNADPRNCPDFTFTGSTSMDTSIATLKNLRLPAFSRASAGSASPDMPDPPSNSSAVSSASTFGSTNKDMDDEFVDLLQTRLAFTERASPSSIDQYAAESQQTAMTGTTEGQLASESEVDILQPRQGRKREGSKSKTISSAMTSKSSNPSLKAKKRVIKNKPRGAVSGDGTAQATSTSAGKGKNVSPSSAMQSSSKGTIVGMRGTKGSITRDTPVKADPEASVDEIGLRRK